VLPERKGAVVERLKSQGRCVPWSAMASTMPRRWRARCRLAMGGGTDVAIESAGITLLRGDLSDWCRREPCRGTMRNIRQNLRSPFLYNAARRSGRAGGCSIHCSDCCCRQWWGLRHGAVIVSVIGQRAAMARLRV